MGYSLTIGELKIEYVNDEDEPRIHLSAEGARNDDAPAFNEPTDYTNERWPSYTVWSDFCEAVGIYELMFGENINKEYCRDDALLSSHPGTMPITERHRREINAALEAYKIKHPDAIPTYGEKQENWYESDENNPKENSWMCRLIWLHYWINWALDNCKQPVFDNM